jgi:O-antigen ligase
MLSYRRLSVTLIYIFSFTMAFGKINNQILNGYWFDVITALAVGVPLFIYLKNVPKQYIFYYAGPLLGLLVTLFLLGIFQGDVFFNVKFLAAIGVYISMSVFFRLHPDKALLSMFYFSIGVAAMVTVYYLGLFEGNYRFSKGRIFLFEENPNSISSRVAIAIIFLFYWVIDNPLRFKRARWLLLLPIPLMFFFVFLTGSKGSTIISGFGVISVFLFSSYSRGLKSILSIISLLLIVSFGVKSFNETTVYKRFQEDSVTELGTREELWLNAVDIFVDNPWGIGEKAYFREAKSRIGRALDTHNLFLYILVTGGVLGIVFFLIFLTRVFRLMVAQIKKRQIITPIIYFVLVLLISKTGGVLTYLVLWYSLAFVTGYRLNTKSYA